MRIEAARQILDQPAVECREVHGEGLRRLTVRARSQVAEFEITDSGIGIEPQDLERVFQPFERGRAPNVRSVPGTGLGLTITKLLTEIMGGEIVVQSKHGTGSTFSVRLLLSEAKPDALQLAPRKKICGYSGPRFSVLLVDDDASRIDIAGTLLRLARLHGLRRAGWLQPAPASRLSAGRIW